MEEEEDRQEEQVEHSMEEEKKKEESEEPALKTQQCDENPQMDDSKLLATVTDAPEIVVAEEEQEAPSIAVEETRVEGESEAPSMVAEGAGSMLVEGEASNLMVGEESLPSMVEREAASSMITERAPSVATEEAPSMVRVEGGSMVDEETAAMVSDEAPSMAEGESCLIIEGGASSMAAEDAPAGDALVGEEAPLTVAEEAPSVVVVDAPSVVAVEAPSMIAEEARSVVAKEAPSMVAEAASLMVAEQPPSRVAVEAPLMIAEEAPSMAAEQAPLMVAQGSPSIVVQEAPSVGGEDAPSIVAEEAHLVVGEEAPLIVAEESNLMVEEESPSKAAEEAHVMVGEEAHVMVGEEAPSKVAQEAPLMVVEEAHLKVGEEDPPVVTEEAPLVVADEALAEDEMEMETEVTEASKSGGEMESEVTEISKSGGKRKRGRPARVQSQAKALPKKTVEEDVCFICFDGGEIVLCDRRGCPKAYHPSCINRDEAFFRSRGRWTCGWHICSNCEKAAQYMCYTCTYSLCKGCIKEAEFFCVRGNKGFCETCRRTVMLIENGELGNKEATQVDFDDKSSWEYLFKEYWLDLKGKLSLTSDEIFQARNPWKGSNALGRKEESSEELYNANDDRGSDSDSSSGHLELTNSKKRKAKSRSKTSKEEVSSSVTQAVGGEGTSTSHDAEWASAELLEFVAHMKNGDKSFVSQFDVQALLLEYIKQNNLRDPRRKSQIICDTRLANLFGKARVGHFEMLKLLENHFVVKEDSHADEIQMANMNSEASQVEADGSGGKKDKRRKTRKKGDEREPQTNLDDYAAIDVHNIKLLFLRRSLMEDLLEDSDKFHDKVVGCFVRIRISGSGQKHDMYRLVQVVGTRKAAEPYKTGKRSTDVVLEILNLNKTEVISIDTISNQEFSEDECKRLRQSIKCGLINRMTVGEVQDKAMTLHALRANDLLESEKLRITHLRDRASEQGRRKELRECVEKLQILNTPEERYRRLQEVPEVHADPNMDPNYESEEDEEEQDDNNMRSRDVGFSRKGRDPISPGKGSSASVDTWSGSRKYAATAMEPGRNTPTKVAWNKGDGAGDRTDEFSWSQGKDVHQSNSWEKQKSQTFGTGLDTATWSGQVDGRSGLAAAVPPEIALGPNSTGVAPSSNFSETDKIWHYKDPSGKIQGPFSMVQLRKWSTTGYFPDDLRIWRAAEKQEDSILLNDALKGNFNKEPPQIGTFTDKSQVDISWNSNGNAGSSAFNGNVKLTNGDGWGSGSFGRTASTTDPRGEQSGYSSRVWDSSKGNNGWSAQSQVHSPRPSLSASGQPLRQPSHPGGQSGGRLNYGHNRGNNLNTNKSNWGPSAETSSNLPSPTPRTSSSSWPPEASQDDRRDFSSPPTPTPTPTPGPTNTGGWTGAQVAETAPTAIGINPIITPPPNTVNAGVSVWVSPAQEESLGWGSSAQKLPSPTPNSAPVLVAQTPVVTGDSTGRNLASAMPSSNYVGPPNMNSGQNIPIVGPNMQHPVPVNPGWGVGPNQNPSLAWGPTPENQNAGWVPPPNANMGWGGSEQGNATAGWGTVPPANPAAIQGTMPQGNTNMGWGPPAPNNTGAWGNQPQPAPNSTGAWANQPKHHSRDRYSSHHDRGSHGGDSGHGGRRPSWNRQSSFGSGGSRGSNRPPSKRPGVCRFHESGHCRKGADCDYLHT